MSEKFDAIIVGASFAGLAVAAQLKGNILLIDQKEIGNGKTSACGTLFDFPVGLEDSIRQFFTEVVLHTRRGDIKFRMPCMFYTFDYTKFCQRMAGNIEVKFKKTKVVGLSGKTVITDKGEFTSDILIDASGWRAVLASLSIPNFVNKDRLSFGIETDVSFPDKQLHFYLNSEILDKGVAWIFPCGDKTRIGVGSYIGETNLKGKLNEFLERFDLKIGNSYGGFFPHELREPAVNNIFLAGDAAGQCLPLTGEGIRPAIFFGRKCGRLVQAVIEKKRSLEEALAEYQEFVRRYRKYYAFLLNFQRMLVALPDSFAALMAKAISNKWILPYLMMRYENIARLKDV